jgi:hypothetical protein
MSSQNVLEKLQLKDEKNLLLQGIPSTLEKQFVKLSFAKNVTPLLKSKKIEFALVFALSKKQLIDILQDVLPALNTDAKFWVAYPKLSAKIVSDLSRDANWDVITKHGYDTVRSVALDNVWTALRFKKPEEDAAHKKPSFSSANPAPGVNYQNKTIETPEALKALFKKNKEAAAYFETLAFSHKREFIEWILSAKKEETIQKRLHITIEKLSEGKKTYSQR